MSGLHMSSAVRRTPWAAVLMWLLLALAASSTVLAQSRPTLSINDVAVDEGQVATFTLTLSATTRREVKVDVRTANGSAIAGSDYDARSTSVTIPRNARTASFAVTTRTDSVAEGDETFTVTLSNAENATIADAQGIGTIRGTPPVGNAPSVSIADVSVTEGSAATFTITLSAAAAAPVTMNFATAAISAGAPGDFTAVSNRALSIPAGATSVTTQVTTTQDTVAEATETFRVTLSNLSSNATFARAEAIGTIVDNDFTSAAQAHATMATYDGPQTCLRCHEDRARQMHGAVHYQGNAAAPNVTNIVAAGKPLAGKGPSGVGAPVISTLALGINTYCGTPSNSARYSCAACHGDAGRWSKTPAQFAALSAAEQQTELANIDCMMCHQQVYKRFPDTATPFTPLTLQNIAYAADGKTLVAAIGSSVTLTGNRGEPAYDAVNKDFQFRPAGAAGSLQYALPAGAPTAAMPITTEQAAQTVHRTTRQACLNCHAGAGGANGAKRGDLSTFLADPPLALDRHMASAANSGANLTCASCHNVNAADGKTAHRMRGRGLDLRANDSAARFTCDAAGCHTSTPHSNVPNGTQINRHTAKVACQTCHIPTYAKVVTTPTGATAGMPTEVVRDWTKPIVSQTVHNARGGWLPDDHRSPNLKPSYAWFDGSSRVTYIGEPVSALPTRPLDASIASFLGMPAGTPSYVLGAPNGGINTAAAKLYPMKEHWAKMAVNNATGALVPHSTGEFFRTGSFCRAVALGIGLNADTACGTSGQNTGVPAGAQLVPVHTYQTINHGVEPQTGALGAATACGNCHSVYGMTGGPARMNLRGAMDYALKTGIGIPAAPTSTGVWNCNVSCHGNKDGTFTQIHARSQHRERGCSSCHAQIVGR